MMSSPSQFGEIDPKVVTPGTILVPVRDDLARYNQFGFSMAALAKPVGTRLVVSTGLNIVASLNDSIEKDFAGDWLLLLGDDHVLPQWMIPKLLSAEKDIVGCVSFTRRAPFHWCLFKEPAGDPRMGGWTLYTEDELPASGLAEVGAIGNAGLMIRKNVIEAFLEDRGHVFANSSGLALNEDLEFCLHARELGFEVYADMDVRLGHLGTMFTVPHFDEDEGWGVSIEFPGGFGRIYLPGVDHRRLFAEAAADDKVVEPDNEEVPA